MNGSWLGEYLVSRVSHIARGRSNQFSLLIKCAPASHATSCFHFLNIWCRHLNFQEVVVELWGLEIQGAGMVKFFNKLMALRKKLRY